MGKLIVKVALGLVVAAAALFGVVLFGMRTGNPAVLDAVRRFNKRVTNPRQLGTAGTPGAYAGIIHHVGRSSGKDYRTPVSPVPTDDGFVVLLPYGTRADWLQNVLAAGRATLEHEGVTYEVDQPEVVPTASVVQHLPAGEQRAARTFGVTQCLVLHRAGVAATAA